MIWRNPMSNIRIPYNYGSVAPDTSTFIQQVNVIETMIHELWCHGTDGICYKVHPYARIETSSGTVGEFVTELFGENGRPNQSIGELPINGSVQYIGLTEICGSRLPFITNPRAPDISSGQRYRNHDPRIVVSRD